MKATDVFTPGKLPEVTYVDDHLKAHARVLLDALDAGAAVISLSGPSKSGKTVFIEKTLGKERLIQVTGAGVQDSGGLWDRVFDIIGTPISRRKTTSKATEIAVTGKVSANAGILGLAVGSGEIGAGGKLGNTSGDQVDYAVDYLQLLIRELSGTGLVVFIDDFHYIPRKVQVEVANQIKEAIRNHVHIIVAAVPYHADDAIRANPDLRGRTVKLDFDYWKPEELAKIANSGFSALNVAAVPVYARLLAAEAAGSPQLMQSLCLTACFENDIREVVTDLRYIASDESDRRKVCGRVAAMTDYSSTVAKMKEGPKVRGQDRKGYMLYDNSVSDVYPLVIRAIALDPPELTFRYQNLQRRIQSLCMNEQPSGSSVTGACSHMAVIANDSENRSVIEWDANSDVFDIRDPYLLFFLRWSN